MRRKGVFVLTEYVSDSKTLERRNEILEMAKKKGMVRVSDLSSYYKMSSVTIRKDLSYLENKGILRRIHGGAVLRSDPQKSVDYFGRREVFRTQKQEVARAAADLIQNGDSVMINVGSTTSYVADYLKDKRDLFVVTNSFTIVEQLMHCEDITTFFLGGRVDPRHQVTVGDNVIEQLAKYSIDKLIMGADGVDPNCGITSVNHVEDYILHQMIAQAKRRIVVADESKLGRAALVQIAPITAFDVLVTNRSDEKAGVIRALEARGIEVIQV